MSQLKIDFPEELVLTCTPSNPAPMTDEQKEFYEKYDAENEGAADFIDGTTWLDVIGMLLAAIIFFVLWVSIWVTDTTKKAAHFVAAFPSKL